MYCTQVNLSFPILTMLQHMSPFSYDVI